MTMTNDPASATGDGGAPVLVVDDGDLDAERIVRAFARLGVASPVVRARDGVEAVERLERARGGTEPVPALMLLDLNMPRMNGLEVLDACAERGLAVPPTLVMSTSAPSLERHAARLAPHERLVKPLSLPETIAALGASELLGPLVTRDDVVLVDDDPDVHELARRLIRRLPRRLTSLDGSRAAAAHLARREAELLIVDARMPDGDGLDLLERLAATRAPGAARTVLSSAGPLDTVDRSRADALGVEVIVKRELFDRASFADRIAPDAPRRAA